MDKKKLQLGLIFAILFVAYAVVLFLLNKNWTLTFWLSLGFIVVAFAFVMFAFFFVSKESRKQQVVGMPITVLTVMYAAVEFVMGTIFMFFNVSFAAVFVPQFIVFVLFLLCFVGAIFSSNNYKTEAQLAQQKQQEEQPTEQQEEKPEQEVQE